MGLASGQISIGLKQWQFSMPRQNFASEHFGTERNQMSLISFGPLAYIGQTFINHILILISNLMLLCTKRDSNFFYLKLQWPSTFVSFYLLLLSKEWSFSPFLSFFVYRGFLILVCGGYIRYILSNRIKQIPE